MLFMQSKKRDLLYHINKTQKPGNSLRCNRRHRSPGHTHIKTNDQNQIPYNVNRSRQHQKIKRHLTVPHSPQNTGQQIIKHAEAHSPADNQNIFPGHIHNIRRRPHNTQQPVHNQNTRKGHNHRNDNRKDRGISHALLHPLLIPGAETLRRQNRKARSQPLQKSQNQKRNRPRGPHSRQSLHAHKPPHNHGIHQTIQLLKNIPDNNRNNKPHNQLKGTPLRHIKFHFQHSSCRAAPRRLHPPKSSRIQSSFFHIFS